MSAFSIRKLPKPLEKAISQEAKKQQKTKTAVVLQILQSAFHLDPKTQKVSDTHRSNRKIKRHYKLYLR